MKKLALCALACLATGSFAQTGASAKFYVVRDPTTKKRAIVDRRPTTKADTIDEQIDFKTRAEAETGMQSMKACGTVQLTTADSFVTPGSLARPDGATLAAY
ncbi:MAG: hypothetical protein BGN91_00395 [Nitrobacter sp. 62-13]|uniref:hypothetical protein n=1 Tax=Nitrobacter sp. 62-13 TaxID=1895797 RepID=UPI000968FEDC|nr:hypothetical protein [Nitrobacter sp. 62-13]OJU25215.1 MAG: hypothetical protein BGN91_00395 [Nitrobacter sp. 62-13]